MADTSGSPNRKKKKLKLEEIAIQEAEKSKEGPKFKKVFGNLSPTTAYLRYMKGRNEDGSLPAGANQEIDTRQ